ncbi:EAL domain-containing protein [Rummeliibacillus stabekisii]|uniref:Diguanylate cyclase n=1 Tax=Rummeliibacillus stabekisii TaxID=241244 RepID=A0A143HA45_9BACL|nr:EAL domain-containing protein [Rummeliibacillus stabekisii]AMW98260.1 hypothetical protein ATY39_01790 [Rummeliibacillus stabekisii]
MKKTTLDQKSLQYIVNQYSSIEQSGLSVLIRKSNEQYSIMYANDMAQNDFGVLHFPKTELAHRYLPSVIWQHLKTMILTVCANETATFENLEHLLTVTEETVFEDQFYYCTIHKHPQDPAFLELLEQNFDPILVVDKEGNILHSNAVANGKFGFVGANLQIDKYVSLFAREEIQKLIDETISSQKSIELADIGLKTIEGKSVIVFIRSIPMLTEQKVSKILLILRDITPSPECESDTSYFTYHDQLTGSWNRKALSVHFKEIIKDSMRTNQKSAILSIDLDRFKRVNKTYGTAAGDMIINAAIERVSQITKSIGSIYRLNGDNFVAVLQNVQKEQVQQVAADIIYSMKKPFLIEDSELATTASIGITYFPDDGASIDELLQKANQALLYAKEKGRSSYRFYQSKMKNQLENTALMEAHLRRAIEKNELMVYYQPQIDLETETITSFEALLRWQNPKFGFVSPGVFIPLAEESELIIDIGNWVLEEACKQLYEWKVQGISNIRIAVNISPKQFREDQLASKILYFLEKYEIEPSLLELEITESSMTDAEDTMKILKQLKSMGLIISVDDFGTGYSSLSYIKRYPIDIIKIDQSFIRDMDTDEKDKAIAQTIIHLAHNLGLDVIAEGVEKEEHVGFLKKQQCKKAQGFLFSKPLPIYELMKEIPLKK